MADGLASCSAPAGCPVRCGSRGPVPGQSIKTSTSLARQGSAQDCGVLVAGWSLAAQASAGSGTSWYRIACLEDLVLLAVSL